MSYPTVQHSFRYLDDDHFLAHASSVELELKLCREKLKTKACVRILNSFKKITNIQADYDTSGKTDKLILLKSARNGRKMIREPIISKLTGLPFCDVVGVNYSTSKMLTSSVRNH